MRLTPNDTAIIKKVISEHVDDPTIILFGSRADDSKKGGDIDLLVQAQKPVSVKTQIKILASLELEGIQRKIDLIVEPSDEKVFNSFFKEIHQKGIVL